MIHFVYIVLHHDVMNKFTISKNVQILNNVFFAFSVFFLNSLFTQLISKFGFLKFLDSEFLLFWSITSFNESYCMIFSFAVLEFVGFFFSKNTLDIVTFIFLSFTVCLCFFLPLIYFLSENLSFLFL